MNYIPGDYFQIPNRHILGKLSLHAQLVFLWICEKANYETGQCKISLGTIARKAHMSRHKILTSIDELIMLGLLDVVKGDRITANVYQIKVLEKPSDSIDVVLASTTSGSTENHGVVPTGTVSILKNKDNIIPDKFDIDEEIQKLINDKKEYIRLIGIYLLKQHEDFDLSYFTTKEQLQLSIKRNVRMAQKIVEFSKEKINQAFADVRETHYKNVSIPWNLETVFKKLAK